MLEFYSTCDQGIRNNTPGFAVAQHFNSTGHSISDVQVRGVALCSGTNIQRKQREMRLIFHLGTVQPERTEYQFQFHLNWEVIQRFNGAETNSGIAHFLCILLMNIYDTQIYFLATTVICSLSTSNECTSCVRVLRSFL